MKKIKRILSVILCLPFAFLLCSCGKTAAAKELKGAHDIERNSWHDLSDEGYKDFLTDVSAFSAKFSENYVKENGYSGENLAVSPLSVYMALAMTSECANGKTQEEILSALGITEEQATEYTSRLYAALSRTVKDRNKVISTLKLTNSIWLSNEIEPNYETLGSLSDNYFCSTYSADFLNKNAAANRALKDFVKKNTNGLINSDFNLSKETLFALVNTLYLKDFWKEFGSLNYSEKVYTFASEDGSESKTKFLESNYSVGRAHEGENYRTFFAKTNNGYKVKFIVPKDGVSVTDVFTKEVLQEVNTLSDYAAIDGNTRYNTRCIFPKFTADCDADLVPVLRALGVNDLFERSCDMSALTLEDVCCDKVIHKAKLSADEDGIEGAAVTIVSIKCMSAAPEHYEEVFEDFVVDKSFAYLVTDSADVVLFSGIISSAS